MSNKTKSSRSDFLSILQRCNISRLLAVCRLDIWYHAAKAQRQLPAAVKHMSLSGVEKHLGFACSARAGKVFARTSGSCTVHIQESGGQQHTTITTPSGRLTSITEKNAPDGTRGLIRKYFVTEKNDYRPLIEYLGDITFEPTYKVFESYDNETGADGLPIAIVGSCPAHELMLNFVGYENFYYHLTDHRAEVEAAIELLTEKYRTELWPVLANSPARFFLHGNHFSSAMTPPPLFKNHFVPYFKQFNDFMHSHEKYTAFHCDADISVLFQEVLQCNFDVADCFATTPLVPYSMADAFEKLNGNIIVWGGVPSPILDSTFPEDVFRDYIDKLFEVVKDRDDFILGISDNAMPGTEWKRLQYISEKLIRFNGARTYDQS